MSLWRMGWRYVWSRATVTVLTLVGVALGVALISSVLTLRREARRTFVDESLVYDLVVGAKGSPLQLVLSSLYHLDMPTGNVPLSRYETLKADRRVRLAVPIGLGDNVGGYRIVGTNLDFFSVQQRDTDTNTTRPLYRVGQGRLFEKDFEAVLGAEVARRTGMRVGDTFVGTHGLVALPGSEQHHEFPYTVVGILEATGSANDRAVFTTLESIWVVHDFEVEVHRRLFSRQRAEPEPEPEAEPEEPARPVPGAGFLFGRADDEPTRKEPEVTAVLVQLQTPGMRLFMADDIRRNTEAMAAIPINQMLRLYDQILLPMQRTLLAVAWVVVVVASLTILATLIQAAERRRRDLAILRALGAHPREIFFLVLIEALLLTTLGVGAGMLVGHGGLALAASHLRESMGVGLSGWTVDSTELRAVAAVWIVGLIAGLIPATLAYRRSPAADLSSS
ncbi:MAG: ABC transporter permease [Candidatus Sumerlaeia bacterium]|nr:ABC transporter permease [Candidatus Sumerlaeia bacterium]